MTDGSPVQFLAQAADEVLGTMFFAFVDVLSSPDELMDGPLMEVAFHGQITFSGPVTGTVDAWCPNDPCKVLCANFLGQEEEEVPDEVTIDAFKEMTNMIVGRFLALVEPEKVCELGLPAVDKTTNIDITPFFDDPERYLVLDTGDGTIAFELTMGEA